MAGPPAPQALLGACGLPSAWAHARQWRILDTGFASGLNFLSAWQTWKADPARPALLHFASVDPSPVAAQDLVDCAAGSPALQPLARELAAQWWGLVPGVHRLAFEGGHVLLTLAIGDAREQLLQQAFTADSIFLRAHDAAREREPPDLRLVKAVARLGRRGTRLATPVADDALRRHLQQCGFRIEPHGEGLAATLDPSWGVRSAGPAVDISPSTALVIGAGLAGASAAASLARRGWDVMVLDAAAHPAAGASALPAGLLAPHASPDDNLLSRLSRAGVRITLRECEARLRAGVDWAPSGAMEHRTAGSAADLGPHGQRWQSARDAGLWHEAAAWVKPAALVRSWLQQAGVGWTAEARVERLQGIPEGWRVLCADGRRFDAALVVVAAALGSGVLLPRPLRLHAVRGQVSWDLIATSGLDAGVTPVNGNGHFLPRVPLDEGDAWLSGSTYVRGDLDVAPRAQEHLANLDRLRKLVPAVAAQLAPGIEAGRVRAWCGVRCASADRRPLVGPVAPGLWVSTAMGSRGLTFGPLAAELLAARLHGEPAPLPLRLADALDVRRQLA